LNQKKLSEENNFFLNILNSSATPSIAVNIAHKWEAENLSIKSKFFTTLVLANLEAFKEAMGMEATLDVFFAEIADERGWVHREQVDGKIDEKVDEVKAVIARGMFREGDSIDKIARVTGLPVNIVRELQI